MDGAYVDELGFAPLEPALHDLMIEIPFDEEGDFTVKDAYDDAGAYKMLKNLGYLETVSVDFYGNIYGGVSAKGRRYKEDFEAWKQRKRDWEEGQRAAHEAEIKAARAHDWRLNVVNGVYALVAAVLGVVLGYLLGKL